MSFADSSQVRLARVTEVTEGTTPASPSFTNVRFTSESLVRTPEKIVSDEITSHRNVTDLILVGRMVAGNINGELSYGTYDSELESLLGGAWTSNVLKNGVARKSFTYEKTFEQGATDSYIRYKGCLINSMQLSVESKQIAKVQFGVMGRGGSSAAAALSGATYAAANSNPVLNASSHVGVLTVAGVSPAPRIKSLTLNVAANLREQPEVGSLDLAGIGMGRLVVTGSADVYFENLAIYDAIHDNDTLGLTFTIGADTGSKYTFNIPSIKLTGGEPQTGGNDQDIILPIQFQGLYNTSGSPANNCTLKITRAVA